MNLVQRLQALATLHGDSSDTPLSEKDFESAKAFVLSKERSKSRSPALPSPGGGFVRLLSPLSEVRFSVGSNAAGMSDAQADAAAASSADAITLDEDDDQDIELGSFGISFSAVERFEMVSVPKTTGRKSAWTLEKLVDSEITTDELLASDPIGFTQLEVSKNTPQLFVTCVCSSALTSWLSVLHQIRKFRKAVDDHVSSGKAGASSRRRRSSFALSWGGSSKAVTHAFREDRETSIPAAMHPAVLKEVLTAEQVTDARKLFLAAANGKAAIGKVAFRKIMKELLEEAGAETFNKSYSEAELMAAFNSKDAKKLGVCEQEAFVDIYWKAIEGDLFTFAEETKQSHRLSFAESEVDFAGDDDEPTPYKEQDLLSLSSKTESDRGSTSLSMKTVQFLEKKAKLKGIRLQFCTSKFVEAGYVTAEDFIDFSEETISDGELRFSWGFEKTEIRRVRKACEDIRLETGTEEPIDFSKSATLKGVSGSDRLSGTDRYSMTSEVPDSTARTSFGAKQSNHAARYGSSLVDGFITERCKIKGLRAQFCASKFAEFGMKTLQDFADFDEETVSDSILKTNWGFEKTEVRRIREACLDARRELHDANEAKEAAKAAVATAAKVAAASRTSVKKKIQTVSNVSGGGRGRGGGRGSGRGDGRGSGRGEGRGEGRSGSIGGRGRESGRGGGSASNTSRRSEAAHENGRQVGRRSEALKAPSLPPAKQPASKAPSESRTKPEKPKHVDPVPIKEIKPRQVTPPQSSEEEEESSESEESDDDGLDDLTSDSDSGDE